jgi:hypothetical protein
MHIGQEILIVDGIGAVIAKGTIDRSEYIQRSVTTDPEYGTFRYANCRLFFTVPLVGNGFGFWNTIPIRPSPRPPSTASRYRSARAPRTLSPNSVTPRGTWIWSWAPRKGAGEPRSDGSLVVRR